MEEASQTPDEGQSTHVKPPEFVVTMAFPANGHDYQPFLDALEDFEAERLFDWTWRIRFRTSLAKLVATLTPRLSRDDRVYIAAVKDEGVWRASLAT